MTYEKQQSQHGLEQLLLGGLVDGVGCNFFVKIFEESMLFVIGEFPVLTAVSFG